MSAAGHEAAAQKEEKAAGEHAAQYDAGATTEHQKCAKGGVCWTSRSNPTDQHSKEAEKHHELASKHRGAATALAQAEAKHCAGIEEADRDMSPFAHREDIASAKPLEEEQPVGKGRVKKLKGAIVVFRAVPGLTAEWLQREVNCHQARAASVGFDMPEMSYCPLMVKDVKVTVSSVGDGFAVELRSDNEASAKEVEHRALALVGASAGSATAPTEPAKAAKPAAPAAPAKPAEPAKR
jgi:hypothetical protein